MEGRRVDRARGMRMRSGAAVLCVVLLFSCTADEEKPAADSASSRDTPASAEPSPRVIASSTRSPSAEPSSRVIPSPAATLNPQGDCAGIGDVSSQGQITYFDSGELRAASVSGNDVECLVRVAGLAGTWHRPVWNAPADRVLLGTRALSRDGSLTRRLTDGPRQTPHWSRPSGTSVVYLHRKGTLMKRSSYGGHSTDISFLDRHDAVTYHPAGEHIATSGFAADGSYGLYLATNLGTEPQLLARGEAARFITNLRFSEDGQSLYYTAWHGRRDWHLHRLRIGQNARLHTLARAHENFEYVVSPFHRNLVAWFVPGNCAAGNNGRFETQGRRLRITAELRSRNVHPVGWLPNGGLAVRAATAGCSSAEPGDVYVLSDQHRPRLIQKENYGNVSLRVAMPPPPRPPDEEQEVVA